MARIVYHILAVLTLFSAFIVAEYKSYKDYKVYKVIPQDEKDLKILKDFKKQGCQFWTDVIKAKSEVRIMVRPDYQGEFVNILGIAGLQAEITVEDVQTLIDDQMKKPKVKRTNSDYSWEHYQTLDEIFEWLDKLADRYSDVVTLVTIGTTVESRPIRGIKIDFKKQDDPVMGMIEGGIHAREWISPATVTWIIKEFLTSDNPNVRSMAENIVWHIFPVINPDGYSYTYTNDRMWRKNRNPANFVLCGDDDDIGNGIDLNRNFGFLWNVSGASSDPCDLIYAGPEANSEIETRSIITYIESLKQQGNLVFYYAFHSYSHMLLIPHSHLAGVDVLEVPNYGDMYEIAIRGAEKLKEKHESEYRVGTLLEVSSDAVTGTSFDWVKGAAEVRLVYLFELRDMGEYGFLLPPEQIADNGEEIVACLVEMDRVSRELGYYTIRNSGFVIKIHTLLLAVFTYFSIALH